MGSLRLLHLLLAFQKIKVLLVNAPVLVHPIEGNQLEVHIDASGLGLGAVLMQLSAGDFHPISDISRRLSPAETNYHSNELECLALVWAVSKFRHYLYGQSFRVKTDNNVVRWLAHKRDIRGKLARWILQLQEFDFSIEHQKSTENRVADDLSHQLVTEEEPLLNDERSFPPTLKKVSENSEICNIRQYSKEELAFWQQGDATIHAALLQ